mmetsp:Transcript_42657/g.109226  ORF Transcript_42657/g.109226 Transcript_42657/m.109226 type:complete len:276 (-) Transcript_42657:1234-2061(-)
MASTARRRDGVCCCHAPHSRRYPIGDKSGCATWQSTIHAASIVHRQEGGADKGQQRVEDRCGLGVHGGTLRRITVHDVLVRQGRHCAFCHFNGAQRGIEHLLRVLERLLQIGELHLVRRHNSHAPVNHHTAAVDDQNGHPLQRHADLVGNAPTEYEPLSLTKAVDGEVGQRGDSGEHLHLRVESQDERSCCWGRRRGRCGRRCRCSRCGRGCRRWGGVIGCSPLVQAAESKLHRQQHLGQSRHLLAPRHCGHALRRGHDRADLLHQHVGVQSLQR